MANVRTYSVSRDGNLFLSPNFQVKEFASKDGADEVKIDLDLIPVVQRFRDYVESPVIISSAFRTAAHNAAVGGAPSSYHVFGRALDIPFSNNYRYLTSRELMARFFNTLGVKGIIIYQTFVHIDSRNSKYHATNTGALLNLDRVNIPYRGQLLTIGSSGTDVGIAQFKLNSLGYNTGNADMIYGPNTANAVRLFQSANELVVDGIIGPNTWNKLFN